MFPLSENLRKHFKSHWIRNYWKSPLFYSLPLKILWRVFQCVYEKSVCVWKLDNEIHSSYSAPLSLEDDLESGLGSGSGDWDEQDGDCELTCAVVRAYSWQPRRSFCRKYYLKRFEFFEVAPMSATVWRQFWSGANEASQKINLGVAFAVFTFSCRDNGALNPFFAAPYKWTASFENWTWRVCNNFRIIPSHYALKN